MALKLFGFLARLRQPDDAVFTERLSGLMLGAATRRNRPAVSPFRFVPSRGVSRGL